MVQKFLDRRPEGSIELLDSALKYFELDITNENFINSKIQKTKIAREIVEKLEDSNFKSEVSVRYSSNYANEEMKSKKPKSYVSDREWQSWHSIDLQLKDVVINPNKITIENLELSKKISYYAFITPYQKKFQILLFSKKNLESLLQKKIEKSSYTIYENAQKKQCVKFNFYFTTSEKDSNDKDRNSISLLSNRNIPFWRRLIVKIKKFFN